MSKKIYALLVSVLAIGILAASAVAASAQTWTPAGAKVVLDSSNLVFEVENSAGGTTTLTCGATIAEGALASPAAATFTTTPFFSDCTASAAGKGTWTATAVNSEEATLGIPKEGAVIVVAVNAKGEPTCSIDVNASTIGKAKDYKIGKTGKTEPSVWQLTSESVTVADSPAECFGKAKTAKVSATIDVLNLTSNASGEEIQP